MTMNNKKKKLDRADFYSFYSQEEGERTSRAQFKTAPRRSPLLTVLFACFVGILAVSAWFGYLFFSQQFGTNGGDPLLLEVKGPTQAENGALVDYSIEYYHIGSESISDVALYVEYPIGFTLVESSPAPQNVKKDFWNIGTLEPGQKGTIRLSGTMTGFAAEERVATFRLEYMHPAYKSPFSIEKKVTTAITSASAERLSISGPQTLNAGGTGEFTLRYQDVSRLGNPENVILALIVPDGVTIESSDPAVSNEEKKEWNGFALSKTVRPDLEGGVLSITLKANSDAKGDGTITARLFLRDASAGDSVLIEAKHALSILRNELSLTLEGQDGPAKSFALGSQNPLKLIVKNMGTDAFKNVEVRMTVTGDVVNFESSAFGEGEIHDTVVLWRPDAITSLQELQSGGEVVLPLTLTLRDTGEDTTVGIELNARIGKDTPIDVVGPRLSLPLLSDARFRAFVREMNDNDSDGQRTFRVYFSVTNTVHDLNDLNISARLAPDSKWVSVNSRSAGDIRFDESKQSVYWTLNALPASVRRIDGSFDILVPADKVSDDFLINDIVFYATDHVINVPIEQRIEGITALETD